jgi:hypothetical protein
MKLKKNFKKEFLNKKQNEPDIYFVLVIQSKTLDWVLTLLWMKLYIFN